MRTVAIHHEQEHQNVLGDEVERDGVGEDFLGGKLIVIRVRRTHCQTPCIPELGHEGVGPTAVVHSTEFRDLLHGPPDILVLIDPRPPPNNGLPVPRWIPGEADSWRYVVLVVSEEALPIVAKTP